MILKGYSTVFCKIQYFTKHVEWPFYYTCTSDFQFSKPFGPPHNKNNEMTHMYNEDSDQPGHLCPVWSVFAVHIKEPWTLTYPLSAQRRLWSDWLDAQLIWVFAGYTGNFVGLVTVWLLFSFNAHKISFLRFQRQVQLVTINWEEVMIMKKPRQWRGKHNVTSEDKTLWPTLFLSSTLLNFPCSSQHGIEMNTISCIL